jgi:H+/Cl- antiporter ClcA
VTTAAPDPAAPVQATVPPPEPLWTPQTIIALIGLAIVGGTVAAVFTKGDTGSQQLVTGIVLGTFGAAIFSFYFGSSKGSQAKDAQASAKDATIAALAGVPTPLPTPAPNPPT